MFWLLCVSVAALALAIACLRGRSAGSTRPVLPHGLPLLGAALVPRALFGIPLLQSSLVLQAPGLALAWGSILSLLSFACLACFIWYNRRAPGFTLLGLGILLNGLVIAANGGQMPVNAGAMARAGNLPLAAQEQAQGSWSRHTFQTPETRLWFLGDIILLPLPFRKPLSISLGDLAIAAGLFRYFNARRTPAAVGLRWSRARRRVSTFRELPRPTRGYVAGIIIASVVIPLATTLLGVGPRDSPRDLPWLLAALFAGAFATQSRPIQIASGPRLTVVSALFVAAFLLTGGLLGPAAVCAGIALAEVVERRPPVRIAFNIAQYLIATCASASLYEWLIERRGYDWYAALLDPPQVPALAAVIATFFLLNSGIVAGVVAMQEGLAFLQVWRQAQRDVRVQYLAMVSLGVVMAMLWQLAPWTWLLVGMIVGVVHLSFAQAARLHQRSEELATASAESDRLRAAAEEHLRQVSMVYRSSVELVGARTASTVPRVLVDIAARAFGFDSAAVFLLTGDQEPDVRVAATWSLLPADERALMYVLSDRELLERLRRGETLVYSTGAAAHAGTRLRAALMSAWVAEGWPAWQLIAVLPLLAGERLLGILVTGYDTPHELDLQDRQLLSILAHQGAQALLRLELAREAGEVETLREVDRARTQILATVSHELRSPLTAVAGYSEVLYDRELPPHEVREIARHISEGARRLVYLVEDIATFYRMGSGAFRIFPQPLEVVPVLHEAAAQIRASASGVPPRICIVAEGPVPDVSADRVRLVQILTNLLSNAVKFSPPGSPIRLAAYDQGRFVVFEVEDQGSGIAPEELGRIFDPFFRSSQSDRKDIQGTGLGLAIVRRLVELQGGSIEVRSRVGEGSTFRVRLPAAVPSDVTAQDGRAAGAPEASA